MENLPLIAASIPERRWDASSGEAVSPHLLFSSSFLDSVAESCYDTFRMVMTVKIPELKFQIRLNRDEDGYWVVECPNLPGCISQGKTQREALGNIREAIRAWLEAEFVAQMRGWKPVWARRSR